MRSKVFAAALMSAVSLQVYGVAAATGSPLSGGAISSREVKGCTYATPCYFDIDTPMGGATRNDNPGGKARAKGSITFTTAHHMQLHVDFVRDICNAQGTGDGLGAYLYLDIRFMNGTSVDWYPRQTTFKDTNGCSAHRYDGDGELTLHSRRRFNSAMAYVTECYTTGCGYDLVSTRWKDNPFT